MISHVMWPIPHVSRARLDKSLAHNGDCAYCWNMQATAGPAQWVAAARLLSRLNSRRPIAVAVYASTGYRLHPHQINVGRRSVHVLGFETSTLPMCPALPAGGCTAMCTTQANNNDVTACMIQQCTAAGQRHVPNNT